MAATTGVGGSPVPDFSGAEHAVNAYFKTNVSEAISKPSDGKEAVLSSRGKISTVAHRKLEEGRLSQDQEAIVSTLLTAVAKIGGGTQLMPGANKKAAEQIADRVLKEYNGDVKEAQRALSQYTTHIGLIQRDRIFMQTVSGDVSRGFLRSQFGGLLPEHWVESVSDTFVVGKEPSLKELTMDIKRYSENKRLSIRDSSGVPIDVMRFDEYEDGGGHFRDYMAKEMLPELMVQVGLAEKGGDGQVVIKKEGRDLIDHFLAKAGDKTSADELRGAMISLVGKMGESNDPGVVRLRFALLAISQNKFVFPGKKLGMMARAGAEEDKYMSLATTPDDDETVVNIGLSKEGAMTADFISQHVNIDPKKTGERLHKTEIRVHMEFDPRKSDDVSADIGITMRIPKEQVDHPEVVGLRKSLELAGFKPKVIIEGEKHVSFAD